MQQRPEILKSLPHPASFEKETLSFLEAFRYEGPRTSIEHIAAVARFFSRLPYENLSKILKKASTRGDARLRFPDEVNHDHERFHLGGTCFSLTYFLCGIYTILGYQAEPVIAHLNWGENTHSAIAIQHDGNRYLVDPGYMIFSPLPLRKTHAQSRLSAETGLSLRFDPEHDEYAVYTFRKRQFVRRYRFNDKQISWDKFAEHWRASFDLPGMDSLTFNRVEGSEMIFVQNDFIKITSPQSVQKLREMDSAEKLIRDRFGIPLEKLEEARSILKKGPGYAS